MGEECYEINIDEMLNQLVRIVRSKEGDAEKVLAKLRELADIAEKIDYLMSEQVEVPVKLVDRWNQLIRELYPEQEGKNDRTGN